MDRPEDQFDFGTITDRNAFGEALRRLRARHARYRDQEQLSLREIARMTKIGVSYGTIRNWLNGKTIPEAKALDELMKLFGAGEAEKKQLAQSRRILSQTTEAEKARAEKAGIAPDDHGETRDERPGRRKRGMIVAGLLALLVVAGTAIVASISSRRAPAFAELSVATPAPSEHWTEADLGCRPQKEWNHTFPGGYRGGVYVQFAVATPTTPMAKVTLIWGSSQWQGVVDAGPGAVHRGRGGTLLGFNKNGSTDQTRPDQNPPVIFRSDVPVCAVFGSATTRPQPAPSLYLRTPGWKPYP